MKPDPQAEIRAAFKQRRLRLGLTQEDMAARLGVNRIGYFRIETVSRLTPEIRASVDRVLTELESEMRQQGKAS